MMNMPHPRRKGLPKGSQGQTAIEYMILLGVVVALVLIAFKTQLPRTRVSANVYFNRTSLGIIGDPNPCGDGLCCDFFEDEEKCPPDCGLGGSGSPGCPGAICTNPFTPSNASVCPGSNAGLMVSEDWTLVPSVADCSSTKCQYYCNSGFMPSGDTCVPAVCSGTAGFANATMCADDDIGITAVTVWTVVPNGGCTSAKCEYECDPGYVQASSVDCVLAQCTGLGFGNATICPMDGTGLMVNTPRTLVASCSFPDPEPKCEYACDGPYVFYGGSCCLPMCVAGACGPGQNNGCGGTIDCPSCCGNGVINSGEVCDTLGPNLNGEDCASQGYPGAVLPLACNGDCLSFDVSGCTTCPAQTLDIGSGLTAMFNETPDTQTFFSSCPSGFSGTPNRTCGAGTWGALNNGCVPDGCPAAVLAVGSGLTGIFPASQHGDTPTLNCATINSGYQGSTSATCDYGSWINVVAGCLPADCPNEIFMDPNAVVLGTFPASLHGTPVTLTCSAIDSHYTGTFGRTCDHGSWLNPVGGCVAQSCPAQTLDIGSSLTGLFSAADHGGTGYASCPGGYTGVPSRVCDYGTWGALSNGCAPVTCTCPDNSIITAGASCAGSYYELSTVACGNSCAAETRTCDAAGVLSGSYMNAGCSMQTCCGNAVIDSGQGEVCDTNGPQLGGRQCSDFGFTGTCGFLGCGGDCTTFDTTGCQNAVDDGIWGAPWTDVGSCGTYTACYKRQQGTCNGASCGGTCPGSGTQDVACGAVNGGWSGWSHPNGFSDGAGGTCSVACNTGTQSRTCTNPLPSCGGSSCSGSSTQSCNTQPCCVSDGSCSAPAPACGTTTTGVDNCGTACSRTGAACGGTWALTTIQSCTGIPMTSLCCSGTQDCGFFNMGFVTSCPVKCPAGSSCPTLGSTCSSTFLGVCIRGFTCQ